MNIYDGVLGIALVVTMAAGIVAGLMAETAYVPHMALAASGLVWYALCRREAPQTAIRYVVLGACILLAIATYGDTKRILASPDAVGVACMVGGLVGLAVVLRWVVPRVPPVLRA